MVVTLSFRSVTHLTDTVHCTVQCHLLWAVGVTLASPGQLSRQRVVKSQTRKPCRHDKM